MRRPSAAAVLVLMLAADLWAAMSDSAAMAKAQALWGAKGLILQCRFPTDTYWTKQVGYFDGTKIVILGSAPNTWDAAFASVQATANFPVCGAAPAVIPTANVTIQPFYQEVVIGMPFTFTVQRDGPTDQDLDVTYYLGNDAKPGVDYVPDPGGTSTPIHMTINKGASSAVLHFQSSANEYVHFVTLQLLPGNYKLAANNAANVGMFLAWMRPDLPASAPLAPNQVPIGETIRLQIPLRNK